MQPVWVLSVDLQTKTANSARSYTFAITPNSSMTNVNAAVEALYA